MGYYNDVVEDLQWAVMDIQRNGILVDQELVRSYYEEACSKLKGIEEDFSSTLGYSINPNSKQQVMQLFNEDFLIPLRDSSDKLTLRRTQIELPSVKPIVSCILDYRDLTKKRSTYLRPKVWPDGRVRSQFRVYGTLTWRLSSRDPDLQNLPRHPTLGINIKNIYVAPRDKLLVEIDKNQLEYRIPAYASRCKNLIERFESGVSVHLANASAIFRKDISDKKSKEYDLAKRVKYARGYGAGTRKVSDVILVDTGEYIEPATISIYVARIEALEPEIRVWQEKCLEEARRTGKLYDGFNTPRTLYGAPTELMQTAYSWPTQATASGVINRALVRIHWWLKAHPAEAKWLKVICQVHDSLLFEIKANELRNIVPQLLELMDQQELIFNYPCVLPSEAKYGERWGDLHEYAA
jgi:DNA polymerase I